MKSAETFTIKGKKPKKRVPGTPSYKEPGTLARMRKALDDAKTQRAWTVFKQEHRAREDAQNLTSELQHLHSQRLDINAPNRYMREHMRNRNRELMNLRKTITDMAGSWQSL
jgi:hypothetical protein